MTTPHAILLVPAEGDPLNLLADGPCGARPPMAGRDAVLNWHPLPWRAAGACWELALVLAWEGEPLKHQIERVHRLWFGHGMGQPSAASSKDWLLAATSVGRSVGTIILLDEHGKEIGR